MKYRIVWVRGNGLTGKRADFETMVVEEVDATAIYPRPQNLYDTVELAEAAATPEALQAYMADELSRLEGIGEGEYREHRGLREYHQFLMSGIESPADVQRKAQYDGSGQPVPIRYTGQEPVQVPTARGPVVIDPATGVQHQEANRDNPAQVVTGRGPAVTDKDAVDDTGKSVNTGAAARSDAAALADAAARSEQRAAAFNPAVAKPDPAFNPMGSKV